jgi:hypothetical protein
MSENLAVSAWPNGDARRGWAARVMLAEDARWVADVVMSANKSDGVKAYPALLLGHHFVRIAYEGAIAIRSANPHVGWQPFADLLTDQYAVITKRARHVTKLLDDTRKGYEGVLADLADTLQCNHDAFMGKAPRWLRWLETDMGLYFLNGSLLGASIPMAYRLDLDPADQHSTSGGPIRAVSEEWGATMVALSAADLREPDLTGSLDLSKCKIMYSDRVASTYLTARYERDFPNELKMLLLMIEGDLNTIREFLPLTATGHELATFRARTVTVYHSLSTLRQVEQRFPVVDTAGMRGLRTLLSDPPTSRLMCREAGLVRNRCVHYEMNDPAIQLDPSLPMSGIVEAVYPGNSWGRFDEDVSNVMERFADHLATWKP